MYAHYTYRHSTNVANADDVITHTHTHTHTYIHIYTHTYIYTHTHTHTHTHTYVLTQQIQARRKHCKHSWRHHRHLHKHICTHKYTHTATYTDTYTYKSHMYTHNINRHGANIASTRGVITDFKTNI